MLKGGQKPAKQQKIKNFKQGKGEKMNKKFMKVRRIVVPTLTLIIMASQFMGCAATTQEETMKMLENNKEVEIEVAELDDEYTDTANKKSNTESVEPIEWTELASLETVPEMRNAWDEIAGIQKTDTGKEGMFYTNSKGENDNNNTLMGALSNGVLKDTLNSKSGDGIGLFHNKSSLAFIITDYYTDIDGLEIVTDINEKVDNEETYNTAFLAGLNAYYNLLPDTEQGKANMNESLTRKEFMAMVYRADTPVQELTEDKEFADAVGNSEYNVYAQNLNNNSYLSTDSGDLNETTYNSAISRAEAIYILTSRYYRDDLSKINTNNINVKFTDAKDNGMSGQDKLDALNESIKDADKGLPTELYAGLAVASEHSIINPELDTRWDESLTKEEALQLLINAYTSNTGTVASLSSDEFEFKTAEQKETDKEAERKAEQERLIEECKQAIASGNTGSTESKAHQAKVKLWNNMTPEEQKAMQGDFSLDLGYKTEQHEDGTHYLVDLVTGETVEIGEFTTFGIQYIGDIENCRADYIKWMRFKSPNTKKTDDEIAAMGGF